MNTVTKTTSPRYVTEYVNYALTEIRRLHQLHRLLKLSIELANTTVTTNITDYLQTRYAMTEGNEMVELAALLRRKLDKYQQLFPNHDPMLDHIIKTLPLTE